MLLLIHFFFNIQVRAQNTIQVIAFLLFNLCCFVYAVFQFKQIADALASQDDNLEQLASWLQQLINRLLIAVAVITGVCQLVYFYIGARLYQEFG
jgi:Ca2+/Na+ antiporter